MVVTIGGLAMMLDQGLKSYEPHRLGLLGPSDENEGKYVAIKGDRLCGPSADYESALEAASTQFGIGGFLAKKIERGETILEFTRDLR